MYRPILKQRMMTKRTARKYSKDTYDKDEEQGNTKSWLGENVEKREA